MGLHGSMVIRSVHKNMGVSLTEHYRSVMAAAPDDLPVHNQLASAGQKAVREQAYPVALGVIHMPLIVILMRETVGSRILMMVPP